MTSGSAGHGPVKHGHFMGKTMGKPMGKQWENPWKTDDFLGVPGKIMETSCRFGLEVSHGGISGDFLGIS